MLMTGQKINLRDIKLKDEEKMFHEIFNNKNVLKYFIAKYYNDYNTFKPMFNKVFETSKRKDCFIWSIVDKDDKFMGLIIEQGRTDDSIELGYCLGEPYWNKGYTTQALLLAILYLYQQTNFKEVTCAFMKENIGSKKVLEKCGFTFAYENLNEIEWDGKMHDVEYYSFKVK